MAKSKPERRLRIIKLQAENFKRLEAVDIDFDAEGNLVVVTGKNGAGKTSLLDAVMAAFVGKRELPAMSLRKGAKEGFIRVHLGDFEVERVFKLGAEGEPIDSTITVRSAEGAKYGSPQSLLNDIVGRISFDPLAFTRMPPREQIAELLRVADVDLNLEEWERRRQGIFDARTDVNRDVRKLEARIEKMPVFADVPASTASATEKAQALAAAKEANFARERARQAIQRIDAEIDRLTKEREGHAAIAIRPAIDVAPLEAELHGLEELNSKINANTNRDLVAAELESVKAQAEKLTKDIERMDAIREGALKAANLPVAGLTFDAEGIKLDGVPFEQCALSQQLMVSTAIAMAANSTLRVILVRDGSLLDSANRDILAKLAKDNDFQILLECVEAEVGIEIVEGRVKEKKN